MNHVEKNMNKGQPNFLKYSNGVRNYSFTTCTATWYFRIDTIGDTWVKISRKGVGLIGVVNVLDWDINDVFNLLGTTQEVNWHRSPDAVDLAG